MAGPFLFAALTGRLSSKRRRLFLAVACGKATGVAFGFAAAFTSDAAGCLLLASFGTALSGAVSSGIKASFEGFASGIATASFAPLAVSVPSKNRC
jgi:hypothetical protein